MAQACAGLRVLDFGQGYGAIPGMVLADYGAEVIKVEPPDGERFRAMPAFLQWNRGKLGVALDLRTEEHRRLSRALAADCDIVIENFRPGVASRLGIAYEELAEANRGLIYLSITGFGQSGRYSHYKAYEGVVAAKCGQHAMRSGYRNDGPIYDAMPKCSYGAAMLGLIGVLSALQARDRTGLGQKVETSLVQANFVYSYGGIRGETPELSAQLRSSAQGRDPRNGAGYRIAECADGKWIQSGNAWHFLDHMLRALEIEHPGDRDKLNALIDAAYKKRPLAEWIEIFEEQDVVYATFMTTQEFMDYPQVAHNKHVVDVLDHNVGPMKQVGPIAQFLDGEWRWPGPAPLVGQHTEQVLRSPSGDRRPRNTSAATNSGQSTLPAGPLQGVTILDFSLYAAAPGGPGILSDLGARVIKIEPPDGDPMGRNPGELFFRINRGKERVAVDLKTPEGRDIVHKLVAKADILVHNFRPGVPERLGIDFATVVEVNPRIIYLYAASFGSSGPDAHRPAFDPVVSAMAGGEILQAGLGNPPQDRRTGDHSALLGVAVGALLGLRAREISGKAQNVETTMLVSSAYLNSDDFIRYEGKPERPLPDSGQYGLHALYRLYRSSGGSWVFLACLTDDEWAAFTDVVGHPEWRGDVRFRTEQDRRASNEVLVRLLEPLFMQRHAADWEMTLQARGVACARADRTWWDFLFEDADGGQDQFIIEFEQPGVGRVEQCGAAINLSGTSGKLDVPESMGASTRALLAEIGFDAPRIAKLKEMGIVNWSEEARKPLMLR